MSLAEVKFHVESLAPLMILNARMADPFEPLVIEMKQITGKGAKMTSEDRRRIMEIQWHGALYLDAEGRPVIPGQNIERMVRDGCSKVQRGNSHVQAGVFCIEDPHVIYDGPPTVDGLRDDKRFWHTTTAKPPGRGRMSVTRPIFPNWSLKFTLQCNTELVGVDELIRYVYAAGLQCGLGTWRPKHGRFRILSPAHPGDRPVEKVSKSKSKVA